MASIYKEHKGAKVWSARVRIQGKSLFKSGFKSKGLAADWANEQQARLRGSTEPKGLGPAKTTLAMALRDYAHAFSTMKKGCAQEVTRINKYLELTGLPRLKIKPPCAEKAGAEGNGKPPFELEEVPLEAQKPLAAGFAAHRERRLARRTKTHAARALLASLPVERIAPHHIHEFVKAMRSDGYADATILQDFALLKHLFNQARDVWGWKSLDNPAKRLKWKPVLVSRDRVMSMEEQGRLGQALASCENPYAAPFVWLAVETSMRKGEQLHEIRWCDIQERCLRLRDSKGGARLVALTKGALAALATVPKGEPHDKVFRTTANALHLAWKRACARAGITNLRIHDLRHTALTRHSKRLGGNIFLLRLISGHKTLSMLARYVNPTIDDVVEALDDTEPPSAVQGFSNDMRGPDEDVGEQLGASPAQKRPGNVVPFMKSKRRAA